MGNLILKDFIVHRYMLLLMLLGIVAYMFVDTSVMFVGIIFTFVIVTSIFSADEKKPIQMLLSSLPYTRREVVSSKYIAALVYLLSVIGVSAISNYVINQQRPDGKAFLLVMGIVIFLLSFVFPFLYKFTSKFLHMAGIGFVIVYLFVLKFLVPNLHDEIRGITAKILAFNDTQIIVGIGVVLCVMYALSWMLSVRIYERKVF